MCVCVCVYIPHDNVQNNDCDDDAGLDIVLDGEGQGGDGDENDGEGVCNLGEEDLPQRWALGPFDGVEAVPDKPGGGFFVAQPIFSVGLEALSNLLGG